MYLVDCHIHSHWSIDAHNSMAEMAQAAIQAGIQEICFTNHLEMYNAQGERNIFDWDALEQEYQYASHSVGNSLKICRGFEIGEIFRDPEYTQKILSEMPETDFMIASQHKLAPRFGSTELYMADFTDSVQTVEYLKDYLETLYAIVQWGHFDVLGHLTLPTRYMRRQGIMTTFDNYESEIREIFRCLIAKGKGIELNTNCGEGMLPDAKWLKLYRECGGEIITMGADAHEVKIVGRHIIEAQKLLRDCEFKYFSTFERHKPLFHCL